MEGIWAAYFVYLLGNKAKLRLQRLNDIPQLSFKPHPLCATMFYSPSKYRNREILLQLRFQKPVMHT